MAVRSRQAALREEHTSRVQNCCWLNSSSELTLETWPESHCSLRSSKRVMAIVICTPMAPQTRTTLPRARRAA